MMSNSAHDEHERGGAGRVRLTAIIGVGMASPT